MNFNNNTTTVSMTQTEFDALTIAELKSVADRLGLDYLVRSTKPALQKIILDSGKCTITVPAAPAAPAGVGHLHATINANGTIRAYCGASGGNFPLIGKTIAEAQAFLSQTLNVASNFRALVNGREVQSTYMLTEGDSLEFVQPSGSKGC